MRILINKLININANIQNVIKHLVEFLDFNNTLDLIIQVKMFSNVLFQTVQESLQKRETYLSTQGFIQVKNLSSVSTVTLVLLLSEIRRITKEDILLLSKYY